MAMNELVCLVCRRRYAPGDLQTCRMCGPQGVLDVQYDYDAIRRTLTRETLASRPPDIWRYRELLPVPPQAAVPPIRVGWTPIHEAPRLAEHVGVARLFVKDEGRNPTASFKDRASAIGVLKAQEFGYHTVACASTGNAASSLAGMAASAGMRAVIFVPERAPEPKVTQLLIFGATVFRVRGSYEDAFELCRDACEHFNWYNRNSGTNPFLVEGKKTAGLEVAEQFATGRLLPDGALPDWVVVSVGDGCTIGGVGKGLNEFKRLGLSATVPRLLGVQAEGAAPIVRAFESGQDVRSCETHTIADSIAVGTPRNWRRALTWIKASGGAMVSVPDDIILGAMRSTARLAGVFGEPAGVTGVAGLRKAVAAGLVSRDARVLVIVTGNGLKDIQTASEAAGAPFDIPPSLGAVAAKLERT